MAVTGIHVFTKNNSQYDLRQAVMWTKLSATVLRVNYRGAPEQAWVEHDLAAWNTAKLASLGVASYGLSAHIFNISNSYWDVRFAAMWTPLAPAAIKVYYEAANDFTWITHPSQTAWELVKQASLAAGG